MTPLRRRLSTDQFLRGRVWRVPLFAAVVFAAAAQSESRPINGAHLAAVLSVTALAVLASAGGATRDGARVAPLAVLAASSLALLALRSQPAGLASAVLVAILLGRIDVHVALVALPLLAGALIAVLVGFNSPLTPVAVGFDVLVVVSSFSASVSFRRLRNDQARMAQLLRELQEGRAAQLEAAKTEERSRIAREIHDVLAHTLSGLAIQIQNARLMVEKGQTIEAHDALDRAAHLVRDGLDESRRAVRALRGDSVPGPELLGLLVADFERTAGLHSDLAVEGEPRPLTSEQRLTVFRTAQEALTNVAKHAPDATSVAVLLRYGGEGTELVVHDLDGRFTHDAPAVSGDAGRADDAAVLRHLGGGHGLTGLRERAQLAGGSLESAPTRDGYRVRLWLPNR